MQCFSRCGADEILRLFLYTPGPDSAAVKFLFPVRSAEKCFHFLFNPDCRRHLHHLQYFVGNAGRNWSGAAFPQVHQHICYGITAFFFQQITAGSCFYCPEYFIIIIKIVSTTNLTSGYSERGRANGRNTICLRHFGSIKTI